MAAIFLGEDELMAMGFSAGVVAGYRDKMKYNIVMTWRKGRWSLPNEIHGREVGVWAPDMVRWSKMIFLTLTELSQICIGFDDDKLASCILLFAQMSTIMDIDPLDIWT